MKNKKIQSYILWAIVIFSAIGLFLSPKDKLMEQLKTNIPWVATGIIASEIILTIGFLLMLSIAAPAFIRSMAKSFKRMVEELLKLKEIISEFDWAHVANKCNNSKIFWLGFWLSVVGASGDGIVLIIGIGRALPISSWGLMILPFWDLGLTYIIRKAIHSSVRKRRINPAG